MGWWETRNGGTVGDEPLDALGDAIAAVVAEYESAFNRRPTKDEWETLLAQVLGSAERGVLDRGAVKRVIIETA